MKKIAYMLAIVTAIIGLAGCNQHQDEKTNQNDPKSHAPEDKTNQNDPKSHAPEDKTNQNDPKSHAPEDKTNQSDPKSHALEDKVYANKVFKDVALAESGDKIIVTGKAQVFEGVFQYALYDGEKVLLEDKYQTEGAPAWGKFEITFAKKLVTTNDTKLELFVYSAKDGSKVDTLEIPIPKP
ncbi:Gmad2 immunoglobulin-like domain-containing protein [Paenibacillus sp. BSR1-1]|uniref:Gmad2 immunoglobulin-like domain-containing protein n=1 Tax=Paenibacillus sp. BSR1-1 TaxID=3020845 RepID=UPI0025AFC957|nr:Gmad2 immunoglobulin-like domain-containing protein [Paenibacillus sp. BSR1-1]MDN3020104.1 Gmad2 immunoglobulin-like domain-containing protein [Paenibacillus sp. BSR1-1]